MFFVRNVNKSSFLKKIRFFFGGGVSLVNKTDNRYINENTLSQNNRMSHAERFPRVSINEGLDL